MNQKPAISLLCRLFSIILPVGLLFSNLGTGEVSPVQAQAVEYETLINLTVNKSGNGSGTIASDPAGIDCGPTCTYDFALDTAVTLTASAAPGSIFTGWSGAGCTGTGSCVVTMTGVTTVTANFDLQVLTLSVTKTGLGTGTVTSDPAGIDCGSICMYDFPSDTVVTLAASAAAGSTFTGWGGACSGSSTCQVTMDAAKSVTATFALNAYTLTVSKAGNGSGTVTSSPAGISCGSTCSADFDFSTLVTLTAGALAGSTFTGWDGACSGSGTCQVTMDAARSVTATFTLNVYTLTLSKTGTGTGTVTSNPAGIDCGLDCSEPYAFNTTVTLTASAATGATFTGWSGGGCSGPGTCQVTMDAARSVTATFTLNVYALTVSKTGNGSGTVTSNPAGISCGLTCSADFDFSTLVTLTPEAAAGSTFTGWGGACSGSDTCQVTMDAARSVTATFTLNVYALTVSKTGTGSGTVTSNPAAINCGSTCSASFNYSTVVTLTPTASPGSSFTGWSGACSGSGTCQVTMDAARSVTASFTINTYTLTISKNGAGLGTVTSSPAGINCGSTCSASFNYITAVTLTASAATGSTFNGWSGGGCSGTGSCIVTMTAAATVTATFGDPTPPTVSWVAPVTNGQVFNVRTQSIQLEASASDNVGISKVTFSRWDYVNLRFVEIGNVSTQPYRISLDPSTLLPGPNEIDAFAYDTAGNSVSSYIWLNHILTYMLTVNKTGGGTGTVTSSPSGVNCGSDCSQVYDENTSVTLTANPSTGSAFTGWSGGGCSGTGTCTVAMTAATTVTANFSVQTPTLTVAKPGTGDGTVTSSPAGINCGSDCSQSYAYNTSVTLTAAAGSGSSFTGWSGGGCSGTGTCTVAMTATTTVSATFTAQGPKLTISKSGNGSGTVTSVPSGINCGTDCSEPYLLNTQVTLTASPASGSSFTGWSGGGCSGTGTCMVTMTTAATIAASFVQLPGKIVLGSPSGTASSAQPTFTWNADVLATWYYLRVKMADNSVLFSQWYQAPNVCSGNTCSTRSPSTIAGGSYAWDVQTWNEGGYGPWSNPMTFTVPFKPGTASLRAPAATIAFLQPAFVWDASPDDGTTDPATWYYLWLNGPSGKVLGQWYEAAAVCSGGSCTVTPTITLENGTSYTWWVQTWNGAGTGPWSTAMSFTPYPVGVAGLLSPGGAIGANYTPLYKWNVVSGATWYYLWVSGPSGKVLNQWYEASAICNSTTCSVTPSVTLGGGQHSWWVQTWNSAGFGPWSSGMSFTTTPLGAATLVTPNGNISTNYNPTYKWNVVPGATWYYLWVNGPSRNLIQQWYQASAICNSTTCSITPAVTLGGGDHTWWVQTWNAAGLGPWSSGMNFTTTPLGAATLVSPGGSITNHKPTYTWNAVPGATYYYLWVNGPSGNVIQQWYTSAQANCTASTCSVTPATTLASGDHTWWIQTWNSAGTGPWSSAKNFTVTP